MTADLASRFADPPPEFGPVPIWWWSGGPLDPTRLRWQMEQLIAGGVRQAVVLNLAPSGPLYGARADSPELFTEAWWEVFTGVCRDAAELGFGLWFYDQLGFSGADLQGGLLRQDPSFTGRALLRVPRDAVLSEGAEVLADLGADRAVSEPRGFDYLSAPACSALRDLVHGEFERRVGHLFGSVLIGSFQDELASMPTWSADFPEQFAKRRGYRIDDLLAHLWEDLGADTAKVRADYQRTRAELAEEAFFQPLHAWHEERGLLAGCDQQHPARAGYPLEATQQYGDYLRTHRWFSAPGSDHWGDAKVHSSLSHLYDRPRTWVEAFHSTGWGGTVEETLDWLLPWLRAGANLYDPHAVYYATPDGSWEWAPPSTCWRQPYWRHYDVFARTVARLCAALTWGDHVCDVAVLFPTTTAAAELETGRPEALMGADRGTSAAQDIYLDVVGTMSWFEPRPGVLDRTGWDLDVLDDDSLVRATVEGGCLVVGRESYAAVVLPGCKVLEAESLRALLALAEAGGTVVLVGDVPETVLGGGADDLARMDELVASGVVRRCAAATDLPAALEHLPRRVEAPGPTLLRSDGESALLLVLAAHPGATVQPEGRRYREEGYDFDPGRYATSATVTVTGVTEPVALWDPVTGTATTLPVRRDGDRLEVDVPFSTVPCALVVFGEQALSLAPGTPLPSADGPAVELDTWTGALLPTLDERWGDSGLPDDPGFAHVWHLEHVVGQAWVDVRVTEGAWAKAVGPARPASLPLPGALPDQSWRDVVWSESHGASGPGDPKGFVPEEFLDFGEAGAGEAVHLRVVLRCPTSQPWQLVLGSCADLEAWWNGAPVRLETSTYYASGTVTPSDDDDVLELRLTAREAGLLRGSWALHATPVTHGPEWLTGVSTLVREVELDGPARGVLQLGTIGRVSLDVNGVEVARHGECDNYTHVAQPRVRRYALDDVLRTGRNTLRLRLHEPRAAAVLDGDVGGCVVVTDGSWSSDGGAVRGLGAVPHDPRWAQLLQRPHPLPHEVQVVAATPAPQRFRFPLPPGAEAVRLPVGGQLEVMVQGHVVVRAGDEHVLDRPAAAGTWCEVVVQPSSSSTGGALWTGPVVITRCSAGPMPLGDWQALGLADYSGGVRYRTTATSSADVLDLGTVRGTAEVRVDGTPVGVRAWSPYAFDVRGLVAPGSTIDVDVYNTLAPHQRAVSTTPWVLPGQDVSGLMGPVVLRSTITRGEA